MGGEGYFKVDGGVGPVWRDLGGGEFVVEECGLGSSMLFFFGCHGEESNAPRLGFGEVCSMLV